jgi:hypothetical protein
VTTLVYVYAVLDTAHNDPLLLGSERLHGIGGETVRLVREGAIAAVVSDVPTEEFDEGPLNAGLADLTWLGPRALAHQQVNARLFEEVEALLPLAFGTVFRTDAGVRGFLTDERPELTRRLECIRGRAEWVVAVRRDRDAALAHVDESVAEVRQLLADAAAASPGRAYLLQRRLDEVRRRAAMAMDVEIVAELMQTLERHADDLFREPLPDEASENPVARLSVLVPRVDEQPFARNIEQLRQTWASRGFALEMTGPWPPYRFGGLSAEVARARR